MQTLSLSEVRKDLSALVASLSSGDNAAVMINVRGKNAAVLVGKEEYERLREAALDREFESLFADFDELNRELAKR